MDDEAARSSFLRDAADADAVKTPKPRSRRARNAIASILLVVVVSALIVELKARRDLATASEAVERLMATHHHHGVTRADVEALIRKRPDGPLGRVGEERIATYTWRGLRAHVLRASYLDPEGKGDSLIRIETH